MFNFEKAQDEASRMKNKINKGEAINYDKANELVNKEKIEKIEELNIGDAFKAELILIMLGHKKATEITVYKHNEKKEKLKKVLEEVGLICDNKDIKDNNTLVVSINQEDVDALMQAEANRDHTEYGKLMSYPESAIEAFNNKDLLLPESEYPSMKGIVFSFKLSKKNYQEEVELLKRWSNAIKKYSPDIYDDLTGNNPEVRKAFLKYLSDYLAIDLEDCEKIDFIDADDLEKHSKYYGEQYDYFNDNRLENVRFGIVPDNLWKKRSQPTESMADDYLVLVKESYFNQEKDSDEIAWLLHELAHCKYFIEDGDNEKYYNEQNIKAFEDIVTDEYPNNKVEKYAFGEQFKFLKESGKSKNEIRGLLKQYYPDVNDQIFFDKVLDEVRIV